MSGLETDTSIIGRRRAAERRADAPRSIRGLARPIPMRRLFVSVLLAAGCASQRAAPPVPSPLHYLSRAEWGARPPMAPMRTHRPSRLTIHHTGVTQSPQRSTADKLRALQQFSQREDSLADGRRKPAWPDVPYHFYVAVDGTVAEGREWRYVGDSNTPYDPTGHLLVVVEGNFETEQLTAEQRQSLDILVPALAKRFGIAADAIGGHRDYAATRCPGTALYEELPRLRALVADSARQ